MYVCIYVVVETAILPLLKVPYITRDNEKHLNKSYRYGKKIAI